MRSVPRKSTADEQSKLLVMKALMFLRNNVKTSVLS